MFSAVRRIAEIWGASVIFGEQRLPRIVVRQSVDSGRKGLR